MKSHVSLAGLLATIMLFASSLMHPASALTKGGAYAVCAMIEQQQCPKASQAGHYFKTCSQWGLQYYSGGAVKCCKKWYCGEIH
jgi:hypothetical protein